MVIVFVISVSGPSIDCVAGVNGKGVERQKLKREEEGEGTPASYNHRAFRITPTSFDALRFHQLSITVVMYVVFNPRYGFPAY